MSESVSLNHILSNRRLSGDTVHFTVTPDWQQGRTMFGGFISALAVVAMRDSLGLDIPLRALQTNFVGPIAAGQVRFVTRLLRQGKNVSQVHCEVWSGDDLAGLVVGVFGAARQTQLPLRTPERKPLPKTVDECVELPFIPNITPAFIQHVQMRWASGSMPYTGQNFWHSGIHIRARDTGVSPEVLIVMLSDGPPTPSLNQFKTPVMGSSVSWSLELPPIPQEPLDEGWFQIDMETHAAADGYVSQSATLWTPSGQLASLGTQVVAVYG